MSNLATSLMTLQFRDSQRSARFVATVEKHAYAGEPTLSNISERLVIADRSCVPDALRGASIARSLARRLIEDARNKGQRVLPLIPFTRAHTFKNKEALADVVRY